MDQVDCEMMGMHITNLNVLRRSLTYGLLTLSFSEECAAMVSVVWDGSCLEEGKVGGGVLWAVRDRVGNRELSA